MKLSVKSLVIAAALASLCSSRLTANQLQNNRCYLHWIFEAKKRLGLSVLNYMITSNHVHLFIHDTGLQRKRNLSESCNCPLVTRPVSAGDGL